MSQPQWGQALISAQGWWGSEEKGVHRWSSTDAQERLGSPVMVSIAPKFWAKFQLPAVTLHQKNADSGFVPQPHQLCSIPAVPQLSPTLGDALPLASPYSSSNHRSPALRDNQDLQTRTASPGLITLWRRRAGCQETCFTSSCPALRKHQTTRAGHLLPGMLKGHFQSALSHTDPQLKVHC